jgi:hypothetical protein
MAVTVGDFIHYKMLVMKIEKAGEMKKICVLRFAPT